MAAMGQGTGQGAAGANGAGDGGQQAAQNGQGDGQQQGQPGADLGQLMEAVQSLQGGQEDMRQFLQTQPWQQQQEPESGQQEPEPVSIDLSFLDDPTVTPDQMGERFAGTVDQMLDHRVQQVIAEHVRPLQERQREAEREQHMRDLVAEFPDFGKQEVASEVLNLSKQYVEAVGWPAELARDPRMWRLTYAAARAYEAAKQEQEGSGDPGVATLEGGSGATAGGTSEGDAFDRMLAGKRGGSVLPFG